jgi:zinc finger CCCH domain-containing protein 13
MGNFKHQSIRTSEREKDKDADRERERDLRDKEGQERLRNVSPVSFGLGSV